MPPIHRLEAEGSTNLTDALEMARGQLVADDRKRYVVILTDGYPDAAESAVEQAMAARRPGIEIVAIGTGDADRDYLRRLASSEQASIFAQERRAGADVRPHRPGHRRGRPRLAGHVMSRRAATDSAPKSARSPRDSGRAGRISGKPTTWP